MKNGYLLTDEVLLSLCDTSDYSGFGLAHQEVQKWLNIMMQDCPLARVVKRLQLNNRFPIFAKHGDIFTADVIGFNYDRTKKRVTVPTFDIVTCPVVPAKLFREHRLIEIRRIFQEAIAALWAAEIDYFQTLLKSCSEYNEFYPKMVLCGDLTEDYLKKATACMQMTGVEPAAIFMTDSDLEKRLMIENMGMKVVNPNEYNQPWDSAIYVFGGSKDPELATAHIVDNGAKFRLKNPDPWGNVWEHPVDLEMKSNAGFLVSRPAVLKITRAKGRIVTRPKAPRIQAFPLGEECESVRCIITDC